MTGQRVAASSRRTTQDVFQKAASDAIAERMEALALEVRGINDPELAIFASTETLSALAFTLQQTRRKIDEIFEYEGFAVSPACDVMLELFQARVRGVPMHVSALCQTLGCPPSVGRRWIYALENMQLLERLCAEGDDHKIALSEKGFLKTAQVLQLHL